MVSVGAGKGQWGFHFMLGGQWGFHLMLGEQLEFHYLWFYSIWFLGQDVSWDIVLSPAPVAILIYINLPFFFSN